MTIVILTAVLIVGATWLLERWRSRRQWKYGEWALIPLWFVPVSALVALLLLQSGIWLGGRLSDAGRVVFVANSLMGCSIEKVERLNRTLTAGRDTMPEVETP